MSAQKKLKNFGVHLAASKFKNSKAKHLHELQNEILGLSNHQLAVIDELASSGKLDHLHYPQVDAKHVLDIARQLKGHTHSQVALARKARQLKGSGVGGIINFSKAVAQKVGRGAMKYGSKVGKAGMKVAKAVGKAGKKVGMWAIEHPRESLMIGSTLVPVAAALLQPDEMEPQPDVPVAAHQREAIDELLDSSDDEKVQKKGGRLRKTNRWLI